MLEIDNYLACQQIHITTSYYNHEKKLYTFEKEARYYSLSWLDSTVLTRYYAPFIYKPSLTICMNLLRKYIYPPLDL